ncbi:9271_t:CDS:10, partial [Funneliformis geosporum]
EWIGLDSTWTRRFLKKAEDLRPEELENLKVKVELEHSDKGLQTYWEGVIHKRMKLEVKRTHILGSLHLLNDDGKYNIKDLSSEGFSNSLSINASSTSKHTLDSTIPVSFKRTKKIRNEESEQGEVQISIFIAKSYESKKKSSGKKGDILPDGTKITKPSLLNYAQTDKGDKTGDEIPLNETDQNYNDYSDEDEEALPPEDSLALPFPAQKFGLCLREKTLKDYKSMLRVPEITGEESSFVLKIEDIVYNGHISQAYKYCTEIHSSSIEDSYLYKISKIYEDFIYKSKDQEDILDFTTKGAHTEVDVILKAYAYIVEGLNKSLTIYLRWSADHINKHKCDVRFMTISGVDMGECEFSVKATATKMICDRCRSARINQSILNGLLEYNFDNNQVKDI